MCASHLLRIVDNRAAKRNNKPRSNYLARYGGMDHSVAGELLHARGGCGAAAVRDAVRPLQLAATSS
jgi:hypothetical protein